MARTYMTNTLSASGNTILGLDNVGSGEEVYVNGTNNPAELRTLVAGTNMTITQSATEITFDAAGGGATSQNIGTGEEVYVTGTSSPFDFRTLVAGTDIGITQNANDLTIDFTGTIPAAATAQNIGTGDEVYVTGTANPFDFRTIIAGTDIAITQNANDLTIDFNGTIPAAATAQNIGTGTGESYVTGTSNPFDFRTITGGTDINVTQTATDITIDFDGTIPAAATAQNIGTGDEVYVTGTANPFDFRTIIAGTDIAITQNANDLTIDFNGTIPAAATAQNIGTGDEVYVTGTANPFDFRTLIAGTNITLTQTATDITIDAAGGGGGGNLQVKNGVPIDATLRAIADNPADTSSEIEISTIKTQIDTMLVGRGLNKAATNSGVGVGVFANTTTASECTALGYNALNALTIGDGNTAIGWSAGSSMIDGGANVLVGGLCGAAMNSGQGNAALGYQALESATTSTSTAVGFQALKSITEEANNTAIGFQAGQALADITISGLASDNTLVGHSAGGNMVLGYQNTIVGSTAGNSIIDGYQNTIMGANAGNSMTDGHLNVIMGYNAGLSITTGFANVAVGVGALGSCTTGTNNTAVGYAALISTTTGSESVAVGRGALQTMSSGAGNTAVGHQAGTAVTTGGDNTLIGYSAGVAITTGGANTIIGEGSAIAMTTGDLNTIVGQGITTGTNKSYQTALGQGITATGNNNVILGALQNDGGFGGVYMWGINDVATGNTQVRFGSVGAPAGSFVLDGTAGTSQGYWNVFINGVARKINCRV